jgi:hypothetical protein
VRLWIVNGRNGWKADIACGILLTMDALFRVAVIAACIMVSGFNSSTCRLPAEWVLARNVDKPLSPPGMPSPLFYARETSRGRWSWQLSTAPSMIGSAPRSSGSYNELLQVLARASSFNPTPLFLFNFAGGQTCAQLNAKRERIAEAAPCSKGGRHCVEGTPPDLSRWANE